LFDDKAVNDYIEEGLKAIDEETQTDEDIREISRLIKDELIRNASKGIETHITDLNGNWTLIFNIMQNQVVLFCYNEARMDIAENYRPLVIQGEIDEDYGPEEALEAVVTAFVAKQFDKFIVEELKDNE
jgi:hypothetical protein